MVKTRNLFISHSWDFGDAYERLCGLLSEASYFQFKNYSVPRDDPIHDAPNQQLLRAAIKRQMSPCHVVVIIAGVYATYSKWINEEIALAQHGFRHPKPILAVQPWASERTSAVVRQAAGRVVGWNTNSIVQGIRTLSP
ncbi:TIR domain-containing protein [Candidatus Poriferisodalis sp.]|uniref:TIR domain-containing protein n=1 Tax=Candidatus Poriferisodalis sp. TaxID=3101277 RepID=UPI003B024726